MSTERIPSPLVTFVKESSDSLKDSDTEIKERMVDFIFMHSISVYTALKFLSVLWKVHLRPISVLPWWRLTRDLLGRSNTGCSFRPTESSNEGILEMRCAVGRIIHNFQKANHFVIHISIIIIFCCTLPKKIFRFLPEQCQ